MNFLKKMGRVNRIFLGKGTCLAYDHRMRLHQKLTSPRLGVHLRLRFSGSKGNGWGLPNSPVKERAGWANSVWDDRYHRDDSCGMARGSSRGIFFDLKEPINGWPRSIGSPRCNVT
jgi:hypothetical protein